MRRRRFLGATATAIGVGLAGCSGGSEDENGGSDDGGSDGGSDDGGSDTSTDFGGWFDNVDNFDSVVDKTGQSEVSVAVGAEGNGGAYAYEPPAVKIDSGTTITWEWTGNGGSHDVSATDEAFGSELVADEGHTFSHTFESTGTFKYVCTPHEALGMKGAVVVE